MSVVCDMATAWVSMVLLSARVTSPSAEKSNLAHKHYVLFFFLLISKSNIFSQLPPPYRPTKRYQTIGTLTASRRGDGGSRKEGVAYAQIFFKNSFFPYGRC